MRDWSNGRRAQNFFIMDGDRFRFLLFTFDWEFVLDFFNKHPEFWFNQRRHKPYTKKYVLNNYKYCNIQEIDPKEKLIYKGTWERVEVYEC